MPPDVARIAAVLDALYPEPPVPLDHTDPFTLLCAVLLSAQTTDKKVNEVTPALFAIAPTPAAMAALTVEQILACIRTVGLAPTKAKHLREMARLLVERHGGRVPAELEALEALPGVGHKTASVVMVQAFGVPAFPVDTHIHRLAARWGLSDGSNVATTERDLRRHFPRDTWARRHLQMIYFGREHCPALRHDASACPICAFAAVTSPPKEAPRSAKKAPAKAPAKKAAVKAPAKKSPATAAAKKAPTKNAPTGAASGAVRSRRGAGSRAG